MTKKLINQGIGNLVGIGLIGASASMVNSMPAGTAKNIAGIVPGLQSVALVSSNLPDSDNSNGHHQHRHRARHKTKQQTQKNFW